jgi:hypothetical protein
VDSTIRLTLKRLNEQIREHIEGESSVSLPILTVSGI